MEESKSLGPANLIIVGLSWVIFVLTWIRLAIRTITGWRAIPTEIHYDLVLILIFFLAAWIIIQRARQYATEMLLTALTLTAVADLVSRLL